MAHLVIRAASAETFLPLDSVIAISQGGQRAMHKDGGYYVFLKPLAENEIISLSCQGFQSCEIPHTASRMTAFLHPISENRTELSLLAAESAKKGETVIAAAFTEGYVPQVLDGSRLIYGNAEAIIESFDAATQKITLTAPLKKAVAQGASLKITAG